MIRLGTSGFSYADWVGEVYPQELPRWQWLPFYTQSFDTVELNVTYYRMPDAKLIRGWIDRTPDDFLFTVKAHKSLTHERNSPDFNAFSDSIAELKQAHKLACVLAQFPHSFHPTPQNRNYLNEVREGFVRFHGRNSEKWWRHDHAWERYDYTYTEEELKEWVPKIRDLDNQATLTLVYANNHYKGQSVDTIQKLQPLLIPLDSG
jgi:uncharacterized protein YecE (DUF72 family)